ncbi:O-methyltransferase [Salinirubellus salinus]|uniref:O-methyltransferase n=1 Tax=Salinirubellus salinus TaxID=1364945 RepID=A0A9E7R5U6_9EURY|nr:O-methyltransferase [Salinirubellus salinus]UWM55764.1 O-methyltransferase [Salinirubellus salinus]
MPPLHDDAVGRLLERFGPPVDDVVHDMEARAARESFPTVGPAVGRTLALCVRLSGARSILELGSGFGYSAYWMARALPEDGFVVLTDRDTERLRAAREYFERGGLTDHAVYGHGDAIELAADLPGTFDLVVLDHDTADYGRGFEAVRELVAPGGALLADNVAVYGDVLTPAGLVATLDGEPAPTPRTEAVAGFLRRVDADPEFEPYLLPVDEGLLVAPRVR